MGKALSAVQKSCAAVRRPYPPRSATKLFGYLAVLPFISLLVYVAGVTQAHIIPRRPEVKLFELFVGSGKGSEPCLSFQEVRYEISMVPGESGLM